MKKKGFTLIELVMTVVIASIAFYALLTVFINTTYQSVNLEALGMGLYLANGKLEELSNRSYGSITSEALSSFGGNFSDFSGLVEVDYVTAEALDVPVVSTIESYKRIKVIVIPPSIEVITLVTDKSNE